VSREANGRVVVLLLLGITVLSTVPLNVLFTHGSQTSSPYPVLRAGDYWNFQYSTGETSHETISNDTCSGTSCINDSEVSAPWSDITWRNADWGIIKENYTDQTGSYFDTYTPVAQTYDWPLVVGNQWTINVTVNEVTKNSTGTFTSNYRLLRTRSVVSETSITVPAGTFDTFQVDEYKDGSLHNRRWLSYQVADIVRSEHYYQGQLGYSSVLTSYSLASANGPGSTGSGPGTTGSGPNSPGQKSPSLPSIFSPLVIMVAAAGAAFAVIVSLLAIRHERGKQKKGVLAGSFSALVLLTVF
jgi:hypothetical protein